ncbi:MAG: transcriptional regulator, AraC family [Paenibacillus sp.]|nr:transcriptional regulator, AraC family [Paenibacillus sp.]
MRREHAPRRQQHIVMIALSGFNGSNIAALASSGNDHYFTVNSCGYEKFMTKNVKKLRENGRPDFQVIYMLKGTGHFWIDGRQTEATKGQIVLFHPNERQEYAYAGKNGPELYWIHFSGYGALQWLETVGLSEKRIYDVGKDPQAIELYKKIMIELQIKAPLFQSAVDSYTMSLMSLFGRKASLVQKPEAYVKDPSILQVMTEMHADCTKKWTVDDIAKQCGLSPNRVMHKFKEQTGSSVIGYLTRIRMDKAKDMLLNTSLSIKEISHLIGYDNQLYFSRLFHKTESLSPRDYRTGEIRHR